MSSYLFKVLYSLKMNLLINKIYIKHLTHWVQWTNESIGYILRNFLYLNANVLFSSSSTWQSNCFYFIKYKSIPVSEWILFFNSLSILRNVRFKIFFKIRILLSFCIKAISYSTVVSGKIRQALHCC